MKLQTRTLSLALAGLVALPTTGCDLVNALLSQEFQIPADLETPPADLNVTDQVNGIESSLCSDPDGFNCAVVKALDYSDDEEVGNPPRIPAEIPISIDILNPETGENETVNVEEWLAEVGIGKDLDFKHVIPMDLSDLIDVSDASAIRDIEVSDVKVAWLENTLTFDTLPMDLYIGVGTVENPLTADAQQLIDDGVVEKVGTIPAQEAETAGEAPVSFVDGGSAKFNEALQGLRFIAVLTMPEGTAVTLKEGSEPHLRRKPTGEASVSLKATLLYTVSAERLSEQARSAAP
jgi:hypothetical protein